VWLVPIAYFVIGGFLWIDNAHAAVAYFSGDAEQLQFYNNRES